MPPDMGESQYDLAWSDLSMYSNDDEPLREMVVRLLQYDSPWRTIGSVHCNTAQAVLDILQVEIDSERTNGAYRATCIKCLSALGKQYDMLPTSLFCHGVRPEGKSPIGEADMRGVTEDGKIVCLKALRLYVHGGSTRDEILKAFCREALLLDLLHPSFCLISPWMADGDLITFLQERPPHLDRYPFYLHELDPQIVHADIRGRNILVKGDFRCVLADFGISLTVETKAPGTSARGCGATRWMPPEMMDSALFQPLYLAARDVYSFGCTIIEIHTGRPPFSDIQTDAAVINAVLINKRMPARPSSREFPSDELWSVVTTCLSSSPQDRPSAKVLQQTLVRMSKAESAVSLGRSPFALPINGGVSHALPDSSPFDDLPSQTEIIPSGVDANDTDSNPPDVPPSSEFTHIHQSTLQRSGTLQIAENIVGQPQKMPGDRCAVCTKAFCERRWICVGKGNRSKCTCDHPRLAVGERVRVSEAKILQYLAAKAKS
ncbi:kinase-like protein [Hymenopellis radicata]|nr:kinase-like protein [Hymenopellis radicata]